MTKMNSKIQSQTGKTFSVHPALIYSIISRQASGLPKALLELAMNSVDAGATRITISLDSKGFIFSDNGKGFKDLDQITSCFETFGTPHEDGDAEYGRYRLGRAQIMCYCETHWHTKNICMNVDLKKELTQDDQEIPLGYTLSSSPEYFDGCKITGKFYEDRFVGSVGELDENDNDLDPSSNRNVISAFSKMVKYLPIPVEINGIVVNKVLGEQPVLDRNDEAVFIINQTFFPSMDYSNKHGIINVFNKGVYAYQIRSKYFSGDVVSNSAIDLNMARNAAKTTCTVAKSISKKINQLDQKIDLDFMKSKRSNSSDINIDVVNFVNDFWKGILGFKSITLTEFKNAMSQKIFIQGNDTKISFEDVFRQLLQRRKKIDQSVQPIEPQLYYYDFDDFEGVFCNHRDKMCVKYGLITAKIFPEKDFLKKINHQVFVPSGILQEFELQAKKRSKVPYWLNSVESALDALNSIQTNFSDTLTTDDAEIGVMYTMLLSHLLNLYIAFKALENPQCIYGMYSGDVDRLLAFDNLSVISQFFTTPILPVTRINVAVLKDEATPKKAKLNHFEKIVADSLSIVTRYAGLRHVPETCFKFVEGTEQKAIHRNDMKVEILINEDNEKNILAWTNGIDLVVFEEKFFKACVAKGDFDSLVFVLFHELSHNENSSETLTHGASFYFVFINLFMKNFQWIAESFHEEITRRILRKIKTKRDIEELAIPEPILESILQRQVDKLLAYTE